MPSFEDPNQQPIDQAQEDVSEQPTDQAQEDNQQPDRQESQQFPDGKFHVDPRGNVLTRKEAERIRKEGPDKD